MGLSLNSKLDLETVLDAAVDSALHLLPGIREAQIYLMGDDKLHFVVSLRDDGARNYRLAEDASLETAARRVVEKVDVITAQMGPIPASANSFETVPGYLTGIPLKIGPLVIGALIVVCRHPDKPGEMELRVLGLLSEQVAMVLDNAKLYQQSQQEIAARARAELRYHAIIQDQTELICRFTVDGCLTFVNDAYCHYFNRTRESLIGCGFMPMIVEDDIPQVESMIASLSATNQVVTCEHRVHMPDGSIRWQQWTDHAIVGAGGVIIEYQSVGRDITQQKTAEHAVLASEERLRQITDNMLDVISRIDMDGRIQYASPSHEWVLGLNSSDVEGGMIYERLHPDDLPQAMVLMAQAVTGIETLKPFALRYRHANGQFLWMECVARLIRDAHGMPLGAVLASRDITMRMRMEDELRQARDQLEFRVSERTAELHKANEQLRESEERYALAMRGANGGLWDWNLKSQHVYFSSRWKSMLGCTDAEIGDSPDEWFKRVHPDDIDLLRAQMEAHLRGHSPCFEHEHRMLHRDGTYRWMLSRGLAVFDSAGAPNRMAGSQTDVTARKVAEEQLVDGSLHDVLTGLPNRLLLLDRLGQALYRVKRNPDRLSAVLFIDLDRFKLINDSLGHMTGDQLLIAVGRKLSISVSPGDTVARLGGDEFAILMDSPMGWMVFCMWPITFRISSRRSPCWKGPNSGFGQHRHRRHHAQL